jgi:hypothetical protein
MPDSYSAWVADNGFRLLGLLIRELGGVDPEVERRLSELLGGDAVPSICRLGLCLPTAKEDEAVVTGAPAAQRREFISVLAERWAQGDARCREQLYGWLKLLRPENSADPLWRLALKEPLAGSGDYQMLAAEVELQRVPASLLNSVAALVLEQWPRFSKAVKKSPGLWQEIARLFPAETEKVLFRLHGTQPLRKVSPDVEEAAGRCCPSPEEVNSLIEYWGTFQTSSQAARMLWRWASADGSPITPPGVSGVVYHLSRLTWPPQIDLQWKDLEACIRLAKAANQTNFFYQHQAELWDSASQGWQSMLLLLLMPLADFTPSPAQLNSLISCRAQLNRHLSQAGIHPARPGRFRVASFKFQEIDYDKDRHLWRDEYAECQLWAVFRRVPVKAQLPKSLTEALKAYAEGQGGELIEERARMCLAYLNAYSATEEFDAALKKVMSEGLLPLLRKSGWSGAQVEEVIRKLLKELAAERGGVFSVFSPRWRRTPHHISISPPALEELMHAVIFSYGSHSRMWRDVNDFLRR